MTFLDKPLGVINENRARLFARYTLGLILVWIGAMNFTAVGPGLFGGWLIDALFLGGLVGSAGVIAMAIGAVQIVLGLGLVAPVGNFQQKSAKATAVLCLASLILMVLGNILVATQGGSPTIGDDQAVAKNFSIMGVALFLAAGTTVAKRRALLITLLGILLIMLWFGVLKFFLFEAELIEPLLATSPLFSWLYAIFDLQGASNFIGVVELTAAFALLIGWWKHKLLFQIGAALCIVTFLGTLSFMITLPGWEETMGFPAIGATGIFLMKDLIMLAGTFLLIANYRDS